MSRILLVLLSLCVASLACGQPEESEQRGSLLRRTIVGAEETRDQWSESWVTFAESIDRYFSNEEVPEGYDNQSYVKLQLRETFGEGGSIESDIRLRAKFDLPNTKRKAKLFFNSDADADNPLEERVRGGSSGERLSREESVTGVEFSPQSEWHRWKRSARIGIRVRAPLVPFGRLRLRRPFSNWGEWQREFQQEFWWFRDKGWGETTEYEMWRPLGDVYRLRYLTALEFEDRNDYFENVQLLSLSQSLGDGKSLEYRVGALASNEFRSRVTGYFSGVNYRNRLYEEWIFLTISPELFFARENGWDGAASITFRLDVFFAD
ncbi:hypothetical protein [Spongiibacter sp.]|uniref:hypothetical protein n=1 Tax=Spongiibacter sp. TaxID=2024860 RepID=UPI00356B4078